MVARVNRGFRQRRADGRKRQPDLPATATGAAVRGSALAGTWAVLRCPPRRRGRAVSRRSLAGRKDGPIVGDRPFWGRRTGDGRSGRAARRAMVARVNRGFRQRRADGRQRQPASGEGFGARGRSGGSAGPRAEAPAGRLAAISRRAEGWPPSWGIGLSGAAEPATGGAAAPLGARWSPASTGASANGEPMAADGNPTFRQRRAGGRKRRTGGRARRRRLLPRLHPLRAPSVAGDGRAARGGGSA